MSLLDPERFWSENVGRRLAAVRSLRHVERDVALSPLPPGEALANAFLANLGGLDPEQDLGLDAFGPWFEFQRSILGVELFDANQAQAHAATLAQLAPAVAAKALGLLHEVADLAEESAARMRHDLLRLDPDAG